MTPRKHLYVSTNQQLTELSGRNSLELAIALGRKWSTGAARLWRAVFPGGLDRCRDSCSAQLSTNYGFSR
jgi:hypothetical protein